MAKAKKRVAKATEVKAPRKVTFTSRSGEVTHEMEGPEEKNLADQVLFKVLEQGPVPSDLKLQWAPSYKGRFINRRGKNACGANSTRNMLVVNGIAEELEAAGVKGIHKPEKTKNYRAIKLTKEHNLDELAKTIGNILGFGRKKEAKEAA